MYRQKINERIRLEPQFGPNQEAVNNTGCEYNFNFKDDFSPDDNFDPEDNLDNGDHLLTFETRERENSGTVITLKQRWQNIDKHLLEMTSTCAQMREGASDEQVIELEKKMKRFNLDVGKLSKSNTSGTKFTPRKRTSKRVQDKQIRFDSSKNPRKKQRRNLFGSK